MHRLTVTEHQLPKFSILMSVYYKEKPVYFRESLTSIYNNTIIPDETVIVVDGPIPDELNDIILEFKERYCIIPVYLIENVGLGTALNLGLEKCSNNIVFRMDTDDLCQNDRFYVQLSFISENRDVVLVGGDIAEYDEDMNILRGIRKVAYSHDSIVALSRHRNPFNHMSVAFRKDAILSVGGYQHHLYMEDYNLWLRVISAKYKVANLPQTLVNVRAGSNMLIRRKGIKYVASEYQLFKLKYKLGVDGFLHSACVFFTRSIMRLLPVTTLKYLYLFTRKTK